MPLIDDVRTSLRGRSTALDSDIQTYIDAAVYDMKRVGIDIPDPLVPEPEVRNAIICYVKANFGTGNEGTKESFMRAYEKLRLGIKLDSKRGG